MRKLLIALLLLNAVCLLAICQPLAVLAGSGSGGGPVDACEGDPTKYALDTNGDTVVDLSDFVTGLSWFFSGGAAPRICLDTTDLEASLAQAEEDRDMNQMYFEMCAEDFGILQDVLNGCAEEVEFLADVLDAAQASSYQDGDSDSGRIVAQATASSRCEAAMDRATGRYAKCLLKVSARAARHGEREPEEDDETQADCRETFNQHVDRALQRHGVENCTSLVAQMEHRTANFAAAIAQEAGGGPRCLCSSCSLPSGVN